eukprot:12233304-Ditylum_brightwellii.AAC.1
MSCSDQYQPVKDVPIGGVATAWTNLRTGNTIVFKMHQVLMFCEELDVTLANLNQIRHVGHMIYDNFIDLHRRLSLEVQDTNIEVSFNIKGVIIGFDTRRPTEEELENCTRIALTDDVPWDPQEIDLQWDK